VILYLAAFIRREEVDAKKSLRLTGMAGHKPPLNLLGRSLHLGGAPPLKWQADTMVGSNTSDQPILPLMGIGLIISCWNHTKHNYKLNFMSYLVTISIQFHLQLIQAINQITCEAGDTLWSVHRHNEGGIGFPGTADVVYEEWQGPHCSKEV